MIYDASKLVITIGRMRERAENSAPIMAKIAGELAAGARRAINASGPGWPGVAPATVEDRGRGRPLAGLLGSLYAESTSTSAAAGFKARSAAVHLTGAGKTPRRDPFESFDRPGRIEEIADEIAEWVTR